MSTVKDLIDEAKKRVVLLLVCVFGLSYLMSLTSSSVWINIPAATALILLGRYLSLDLDFRKKTSTHDPLKDQTTSKKSIQLHKSPLKKPNWRKKINSPPVEAAIDQFTRHLISEWVTDLWYARITTDKDGPEELVNMINSVLGEISFRARDINLINLLTRDVIGIICNNLELYRYSHLKIKKQNLRKLESEDKELKTILAADNKLHPALFSVEAEHKVLQHLMTGFMQITFKPEDLQCTFFRYTVRELLACTVFRPILNLACPRVINEKIEALVISVANKAKKPQSSEKSTTVKPLNTLSDPNSGLQDLSTNGLELIQLRQVQSSTEKVEKSNGENDQINHHSEKTNNLASDSGAEWAHKLDIMSKRKTRVLAPENLESLWTKGRNYKNNEGKVRAAAASSSISQDRHTSHTIPKKSFGSSYKDQHPVAESESSQFQKPLCYNKTEDASHEETDFESETSYETEVDESNTLDSPGTKVWDSKNKKNDVISHIHHPLETSQLIPRKKKSSSSISHSKTTKTKLGRKRARSSDIKVPLWQETERTSFLLSEGHDILHDTKSESKAVEFSDEAEGDNWSRVHSGVDALSSLSSISTSESYASSLMSPQNSVLADSFLKLRCEVLGANIVKSGSVTFAVYSIAVTDANNKSWSIKRRYRHFEELHKRLKEYPEYNLHLPPKHFLSSGLEGAIILERCKSLNKYLKILLYLPTISGSIEVWDFLSVDSQTYMFSDSLSIIQTLSVISDDKSTESEPKVLNSGQNISSQSSLNGNTQHGLPVNNNNDGNSSGLRNRNLKHISENNHGKNVASSSYPDYPGTDSAHKLHADVPSSSNYKESKIDRDANAESSQIFEDIDESDIPVERVSQNLSIPILNLVDVIFQLQDGGWIRRQAFWVAKRILQLGMGDAFDDWLMEKIQILRKETVIASAINRVEQILWPDGIFLTKHPNRKPPTPVTSPVSQKGNDTTESKKEENQLTPEQQLEAIKRAKFVYELMIDKAPATLVSLVGRSEYERCAEDVYYFLQSSLCVKQLAFELLELILLSIFPELDDVIKQCRENKEMFGQIVDAR